MSHPPRRMGFLRAEGGQVSTEFVVLCAIICGLGFAAVMLAGSPADDRAGAEIESYFEDSPNGTGIIVEEIEVASSDGGTPVIVIEEEPEEEVVEEEPEEEVAEEDTDDALYAAYDFSYYSPAKLDGMQWTLQVFANFFRSDDKLRQKLASSYATLQEAIANGENDNKLKRKADYVASYLSELDYRGSARVDNHVEIVRALEQVGAITI